MTHANTPDDLARTPLRSVSAALAVCLFMAAPSSHAADVRWGVTVSLPVVVAEPAPVYMAQTPYPVAAPLYQPQPQPQPNYQPAPFQVQAPAPAPVAPALPAIEPLQAQQQARIQWGAQVGLITPREFHRLQQTQSYIEQQRRWAYADGWLTYDEHINLIGLINGAGQQIEHALANWNRVDVRYMTQFPMPPVFAPWQMPRHAHEGRGAHAPAPVAQPVRVPAQVAAPVVVPVAAPQPAPVQPSPAQQPPRQHRSVQREIWEMQR
jgi:hypothetical protein